MEVWQLCNLGFVMGATAGLSQLLSSRRALTVRVTIAVVLNAGLSGCAAVCVAVDAANVQDVGKLVAVAILTGFSGAPVISRVVDVVQRLQLTDRKKEPLE